MITVVEGTQNLKGVAPSSIHMVFGDFASRARYFINEGIPEHLLSYLPLNHCRPKISVASSYAVAVGECQLTFLPYRFFLSVYPHIKCLVSTKNDVFLRISTCWNAVKLWHWNPIRCLFTTLHNAEYTILFLNDSAIINSSEWDGGTIDWCTLM